MTTLSLQHCECRLRGASMLVIAWLLGAVLLSASGLLAHGDGLLRLLMPAMILLPIAVFAIAYRGNEAFRTRVLSIDTGILVILHSWRMVGMGFLFLYAHNILPGLFAWLAGMGDMLAAAGAMVIGTALLKGKTVSRQALWSWNTFGLLDFIVAVVVGTSLRSIYLGGTVNTDAMALLPLSLVPTIIVPLYIITHVVIYLQLRNNQ
ncbi:MAG: hypothetical protein OEU91_04785 [Gammaproteobacteria bacterium]|nr:hypothetical protein [Gammaproteobacteria bacterium]